MKYKLSKIIPIHFTTNYTRKGLKYRATWWQWAGRIYFHKQVEVV